ncbi:hypothetical protein GCM10025867_06770 [Frondihabitans sucicola]|uniref:Uncharacterized protein n=1 Tax=Frondihabitans sucicola TaxID=1268041 RepID=A0ABN6XXN8_9MICO|nr:hypothetical protein GCM10025867_06770 [Frondihabitans sucicola]
MPGLAGEGECEPARTRDRRDDGQGTVGLLEVRPLLDVHLEIADDLVRSMGGLADPRRVETELDERLAKREPGGVGELPPGLRPGAGHGSRSQQGRAEARPLLVAERQDLDREGQSDVFRAQAVHGRDRDHDAQDPVEPAGVGNGVEMRSEQECR